MREVVVVAELFDGVLLENLVVDDVIHSERFVVVLLFDEDVDCGRLKVNAGGGRGYLRPRGPGCAPEADAAPVAAAPAEPGAGAAAGGALLSPGLSQRAEQRARR